MDKNKHSKYFIKMVQNWEPFCFQRFNDGEINAMIHGEGKIISRGAQVVDESLSEEMKKAIIYEAPNYWKGMPCPECFPEYARFANKLVRKDYPYKTLATLMVNDNWPYLIDKILETIDKERSVWVVSGNDQDWTFLNNYGINFKKHLKVPPTNSWSYRDRLINEWKHLPQDSIVFLSCGPLSRILGWKWWSNHSCCTIIDCGTSSDLYSKGKELPFMNFDINGQNGPWYCSICNTKGRKIQNK